MHCKKSSEVAGTGTIFSLNSVDQCKEENEKHSILLGGLWNGDGKWNFKKGKVGKRGTINVFHKTKGELPRKTLGNPLWFSHNRAEKNSKCIVKEIKSQGLR